VCACKCTCVCEHVYACVRICVRAYMCVVLVYMCMCVTANITCTLAGLGACSNRFPGCLLCAGAFMPGEFEERLKAVLKELTEPERK